MTGLPEKAGTSSILLGNFKPLSVTERPSRRNSKKNLDLKLKKKKQNRKIKIQICTTQLTHLREWTFVKHSAQCCNVLLKNTENLYKNVPHWTIKQVSTKWADCGQTILYVLWAIKPDNNQNLLMKTAWR